MIKVGNKVKRNLEETVQYLVNYHDVNQGLVQWGIRVVGQVENESELPVPYDGDYGDAIAVGTEAPFFFYIWTRASIEGNPPYWFPFGEISIVGPEGPKGDRGEKGDTGESTKWYSGSSAPNEYSQVYVDGDMYLQTNGQVYKYQNGSWQSVVNIRGPQGIQGVQGPQGIPGPEGPQGLKGDRGDAGGLVNIRGILSNQGQLPLPSSLQNLTVAYLVGADNPYDLYIQVGSIPEDAVWTNTGPFNVATMVTVNGQYQNIWNADVKADKTELQNYIAKADFNLQNGEGVDSLVQKYSGTVDSTHYGNTSTGESAVVFGEANKNTANRAVIAGKLNENSGVNAVICGTTNNNTGNNALISGYKNINKAQNSDISGRENYNYSEASSVSGSGNTNGIESNPSESYGSNVSGAGNTNTAKYANISGSTNTNDGSSATVGGQNNNNTGGRAIVAGMGNTNSGHDTIVVGKGLKNSHENTTVFGKYNANKSANLLEIGNGTDAEHPSNAFEVLRDGRAKVYGSAIDPEDVVTKGALDWKLDKIITSTEYNQVYVKAANGGQGTINVTKQIVSEAIPQRWIDGHIYVPEVPEEKNDATSKAYVDSQIASQKLYQHNILLDNSNMSFGGCKCALSVISTNSTPATNWNELVNILPSGTTPLSGYYYHDDSFRDYNIAIALSKTGTGVNITYAYGAARTFNSHTPTTDTTPSVIDIVTNLN